MRNVSPLSLHIPEPAARPGDAPDFRHIQLPEAGSVRRPDPAVDPSDIKNHLITMGEWSEAQQQSYESEATAEIRERQHEAEAIGVLGKDQQPSPRAIFDYVFEEPDWRLTRQRQDMGV